MPNMMTVGVSLPCKLSEKLVCCTPGLCCIADGADVAGGAGQALVAYQLAGRKQAGGHQVWDDTRPLHLLANIARIISAKV
jgi:hypothetical protein